MKIEEKKIAFDQCRYDLHMADAWASELNQGGLINVELAAELERRTTRAHCSAQAFLNLMLGVEPPKVGQ